MQILQGDCRELLKALPDESIDSIVTDPPYELGFMGKRWDASGIAYDINVWRECLRVLKPGGHLLSFGGTRTYHRMTCAIEDAGFEIRDCIMWVYGSGFPKSHDVSKAIDKAAGAEREVVGPSRANIRANLKYGGNDPSHNHGRYGAVTHPPLTAPATDAARQWQGWGSALKPAVEPIVVARKPLDGTIADNVLRHGTGAINVDGCRVGMAEHSDQQWLDKYRYGRRGINNNFVNDFDADKCPKSPQGRWPANLIHDGSDEVLALFPQDNARFLYCAKTSPSERGEDNRHPTVKPLALMRYLCRLVTPPKGTVLDPFAGSGTTLVAAKAEGFLAVGCELMPEHIEIIKGRLDMPVEAELTDAEPTTQEAPKTSKPTQLKLLLG